MSNGVEGEVNYRSMGVDFNTAFFGREDRGAVYLTLKHQAAELDDFVLTNGGGRPDRNVRAPRITRGLAREMRGRGGVCDPCRVGLDLTDDRGCWGAQPPYFLRDRHASGAYGSSEPRRIIDTPKPGVAVGCGE